MINPFKKSENQTWMLPSQWIPFLGKKTVGLVVLACLLGVGLFLTEISFALVLQRALSLTGILPTDNLPDKHWIKTLATKQSALIVLVIVGLVRAGLNFLQSYSQSATNVIVTRLFKARAYLICLFSKDESMERLMERNQQAVHAGLFVSNLQGAIFNGVLILALGLALLKIMPILTLTIGVILGVALFPIKTLDSNAVRWGKQITVEFGKVDAVLFRSIKNLLFLRIYNSESLELNKSLKHLDLACHAWDRVGLYTALKFFMPQAIGVLVLAMIIFTFDSPFFSVYHSEMKGTNMVTFLYIFIRAVQTLAQVQICMAGVYSYRDPLITYFAWWKTDGKKVLNQISDSKNKPTAKPFGGPIGWELRNVGFQYAAHHPWVLRTLDLSLKPGTCVVLFGASGAGKSTLLSLLMGVHSPSTGEVYLNDSLAANGKHLVLLNEGKEKLLASVGYVGPDSFIVEGSIRENIRYGSPPDKVEENCGDAEIVEALRAAECDFVFTLKGGLDYHLTEQGEGLSAGQKQRLALARALLRKPKVLILDEATSNLDIHTEAKILETLRHLKKEMTIVAVTHRETFAKIADHHLHMEAATSSSTTSLLRVQNVPLTH